MLRFTTLTDLILRVSAEDLAEVASQDDHRVQGELLRAAIGGEDLSHDYTPAEQAAVAIALDRLSQHLRDAEAELLAYLKARYPTPDPSDHLKTLTLDMALYRLFGGDDASEQRHRYNAAIAYLRDVSKGVLDLAAGDDAKPATRSDALPQVSSRPRVFDDSTLAEF